MFDRKLRIALLVINSQMKVISRQERIIEELVRQKKARYLTATYFIDNLQTLPTMATINVPGSANSVAGQLVPRDAGGNALPWSAVQPTSEAYSNSDNSVATVSNSAGGAFTVTRANPAGGTTTVTYTALNANGDTITGSDDIVFEPAGGTPALATSLTADFQAPV
jgi:hypothetical protein